jgi:hypothetical protein
MDTPIHPPAGLSSAIEVSRGSFALGGRSVRLLNRNRFQLTSRSPPVRSQVENAAERNSPYLSWEKPKNPR